MTEIFVEGDGGNTVKTYDVGGYRVPKFGKGITEIKDIFDNVPNIPVRDDDYVLCSYPKTGTNWCYEILMMVLNKSAKRKHDINKLKTMLEARTVDQLDEQPSPRVLNTHCLPRYLPKAMSERKCKTVLCLRNPKDVAVSFFNHFRGLKSYAYDGKWENWLRPYLDGQCKIIVALSARGEYGKYTDYLNSWQELIEGGAEFPLHVMYYEDLKKDGLRAFDRLAKFLEVDVDDKLKTDILNACHFDKMRQERTFEDFPWLLRDNFAFFRKGEVGDWKNWFTVAQSEMFDRVWKENIRHDSIFHFKYC